MITGYTSKKKENLTTSVATVDAKQINDIPICFFWSNTYGKTPGVSVGLDREQPGTASSIVIRG